MKYEVRESSINGKGLFASEDILKGEKICDYYGNEMTWSNFTYKYGKYKYNSLHTYPMRRIWRIIVAKEEPYKSQNPVNFINEGVSEANNCILKKRALYALQSIKKDEELLLQYPKDYYREWNQPQQQ